MRVYVCVCVQEVHIEVRCTKDFRVKKVMLVKGVRAKAKVCKNGVYVCVCDRVVRESAVGESACVCVCVC